MTRVKSSSGRHFALTVAAIAVFVVVAVIGVSALRGAGASSDEDGRRIETIPVAATAVRYEDQTRIQAYFPGLITARRQSALGFPAGGQIAEIQVDVGDRVEMGQPLARLDTRALNAQLQAARADIRVAQAQSDLADVTLSRQQSLVERGHVSGQSLDEAQASYDAAVARIQSAQAVRDTLDVQIELATLSAPFAGVITDRSFDEGASVGAGAPVLTLVESAALELRVGLPSDDATRLSVGEVYDVELNSGERLSVTLRAITQVIETRERTVSAVFDVPASASVSSGSVARLVLDHTLSERGFWASAGALSEGRRGMWSIYALAPSGDYFVLEPLPVEILHSEGDRVYLRGAVEDGQHVLTAGVHRVAPGQPVRPVSEG
ncbi:efflux RND transporter periplasmic adaptor subunit [Oceanicaulis alexandrii]|uniref:efflux RND transporter periplasmic adaptor subunit n=1 Tax=Oceanicaulis alexandrii TaxID=153233 RepID=UPI0035D04692